METNILARVPGPYLAAALNSMPPPETVAADTMDAVIEVPGFGQVRVTARRHRSRKGKAVMVFWTAERAVVT